MRAEVADKSSFLGRVRREEDDSGEKEDGEEDIPNVEDLYVLTISLVK